MTLFLETLSNLSLLMLYSNLFIFRYFLVIKYGKEILSYSAEYDLIKNGNNTQERDLSTINASLTIYLFFWGFISFMFLIFFNKWLLIFPICFALVLGSFTEKKDIKYLDIGNYKSFLFYNIIWENENNKIAKIDKIILIISFSILLILSFLT